MVAQWTGEVISKMHLCKITQKELAEHIGYTKEYVNMVLNGKRCPEKAEETFRKALSELETSKSEERKTS